MIMLSLRLLYDIFVSNIVSVQLLLQKYYDAQSTNTKLKYERTQLLKERSALVSPVAAHRGVCPRPDSLPVLPPPLPPAEMYPPPWPSPLPLSRSLSLPAPQSAAVSPPALGQRHGQWGWTLIPKVQSLMTLTPGIQSLMTLTLRVQSLMTCDFLERGASPSSGLASVIAGREGEVGDQDASRLGSMGESSRNVGQDASSSGWNSSYDLGLLSGLTSALSTIDQAPLQLWLETWRGFLGGFG